MPNRFHNTVRFIKDNRNLLSLSSITFNEDGIPSISEPPLKSSQSFILGRRRYYTQIVSNGSEHTFQIWSDLGALPYSAENPGYRKQLLHIMKRSTEQKALRLIVSKDKNVIIFQQQILNGEINHRLFIEAIMRFLYQSQPFIQIVGNYTN